MMNETETESTTIPMDQGAVLSDRPSGVSCPACRNDLFLGEIMGSQLAGCSRCGGMLFQQETFAALVMHLRAISPAHSKMPEPMDPSQLDVRRSCPTCVSSLETHPYGGPGNAVIDTCATCRIIWLDAGELTKLVIAPGRR